VKLDFMNEIEKQTEW